MELSHTSGIINLNSTFPVFCINILLVRILTVKDVPR